MFIIGRKVLRGWGGSGVFFSIWVLLEFGLCFVFFGFLEVIGVWGRSYFGVNF